MRPPFTPRGWDGSASHERTLLYRWFSLFASDPDRDVSRRKAEEGYGAPVEVATPGAVFDVTAG